MDDGLPQSSCGPGAYSGQQQGEVGLVFRPFSEDELQGPSRLFLGFLGEVVVVAAHEVTGWYGGVLVAPPRRAFLPAVA